MHIERCDIDNCMNEWHVPDRRDAKSIAMLSVGLEPRLEPGWRRIVEVVMVPVALPPEFSDANLMPMLGDLFAEGSKRAGGMSREVTRLVCPKHDGETWPLRWKQSVEVDDAEEKVYDGIPRDADGNVIPLG